MLTVKCDCGFDTAGNLDEILGPMERHFSNNPEHVLIVEPLGLGLKLAPKSSIKEREVIMKPAA